MVAVADEHPVVVRVQGLKKGFGAGATRIEVLRGIEMEARSGEMLLLVGPSGCGKTTLLTLIAGLLHEDAGSIEVFGDRLERLSEKQKTAFRMANLGFIFQQFNLIPTLTAAENVAVPLLIRRLARSDALHRANEMLGKVGLGGRGHEAPAVLSAGEQQRVAIARALAGEPRLLICDEPTASLDGETGLRIMELLRTHAVNRERCVIVVTHDSRIFNFGDRIARMLDGRIESLVKAG